MPNYSEILRLHELGIGQRKISQQVQSSRDTIRKVIETAVQQNISYGDILSKTDEEMAKIFAGTQSSAAKADPIYEMPDYERLAKELQQPGVTMTLLWEEYSYECRQSGKIPYKRSQFMYHFDQHLQHTAYAGQTEPPHPDFESHSV